MKLQILLLTSLLLVQLYAYPVPELSLDRIRGKLNDLEKDILESHESTLKSIVELRDLLDQAAIIPEQNTVVDEERKIEESDMEQQWRGSEGEEETAEDRVIAKHEERDQSKDVLDQLDLLIEDKVENNVEDKVADNVEDKVVEQYREEQDREPSQDVEETNVERKIEKEIVETKESSKQKVEEDAADAYLRELGLA